MAKYLFIIVHCVQCIMYIMQFSCLRQLYLSTVGNLIQSPVLVTSLGASRRPQPFMSSISDFFHNILMELKQKFWQSFFGNSDQSHNSIKSLCIWKTGSRGPFLKNQYGKDFFRGPIIFYKYESSQCILIHVLHQC